jgi:hypothetical protein
MPETVTQNHGRKPLIDTAKTAAERISQIIGPPVDKCVVIFTTSDQRIGYASYGSNSGNCGVARRWADALYASSVENMADLVSLHFWRDASGLWADTKLNWELLERQVVDRIRVLAQATKAEGSTPEANHMIFRDLVMPNIWMLCRFVEAVQIGEEVGG